MTAGPPAEAGRAEAASGVVFDVQRYAVHDGPGIRTLVFLKGCPLRCSWCCNPESWSSGLELRHVDARCRGCLSCLLACPHGAVTAPGGRPRFARARCRRCRTRDCAAACPQGALAVIGRRVQIDQLVDEIARDRDFYRNSGGGVTFSGGEPFAQGRFLLAALAACRRAGIHTAVETCGATDRALVQTALPLVDLFLFDVKLADPDRHRRATGRSNARVITNLRLIAAQAPERIVARVPLVPAVTDDDENLGAIASLLASLGVRRATVQPYHPLGRDKHAQLGRDRPPDLPAPDAGRIAAAIATFAAAGLQCEHA